VSPEKTVVGGHLLNCLKITGPQGITIIVKQQSDGSEIRAR